MSIKQQPPGNSKDNIVENDIFYRRSYPSSAGICILLASSSTIKMSWLYTSRHHFSFLVRLSPAIQIHKELQLISIHFFSYENLWRHSVYLQETRFNSCTEIKATAWGILALSMVHWHVS